MDARAVMGHLRNDDNINRWVCQFCNEAFPYDVHPEVIRYHLTLICGRAPEGVKEAAQRVEEDEFSISVEVTQTEGSRNAGRECSRSVNWVPTRILDASENSDSNFEAETDSNIVGRSNKRQRSTQDGLPIVAPNCSLGDDESRGSDKAMVGWLKIKAAMRWGLFIRKKAAERRAQLVESDDSSNAL